MKRAFWLCVCSLLFVGCASNSLQSLGIKDSYETKKVNATTYFIKVTPNALTSPIVTMGNTKPKWLLKASELCASDDYYHTIKGKYVGKDGFTFTTNPVRPYVYGYAYCNNKFKDTRLVKSDEHYATYLNLTHEELTFQDFTPFWAMLMNADYDNLETALQDFEKAKENAEVSQADFATLLETFSRVIPESEKHFNNWVEQFPKSHFAYFARASYLESMAWHYRGQGFRDSVSDEDYAKFKELSNLALKDIETALELSPSFATAHSLNISLTLTQKSKDEMRLAFENAEKAGAATLSVQSAYLRGLQPRWGGSDEQMKTFIDQQVTKAPENQALEAYYLLDVGHRLHFDKKHEEALKTYKQALSFHDSAYAHFRLALLLIDMERYVEAREHLHKTLTESPYYTSAYSTAYSLFIKQNDYMAALVATNYLTAMNNQKAFNYSRQGDLYFSMRRYKDALVSYKIADSLGPLAIRKHDIRHAEFQLAQRERDAKDKASAAPAPSI